MRLVRAAPLMILLWGMPAAAWQEVLVQADQVNISLERDGLATIRHELVVKIRGGPVRSIELEGLGADIEIEADPRVRLARATHASWPLEVLARPDGSATLKIVAERGLRGGTYLFGFGYRHHFELGDEIQRKGSTIRVNYRGPRFKNGIDTAKLTWSLPSGTVEPRLPELEAGAGASPLLAQVRRGARDEVDLVRTHIARDEPALWALEVSGDALDGASPAVEARIERHSSIRTVTPTWTRSQLVALLFCVGLSILTFLKARAIEKATARLQLKCWALLPLSPWLRGLVAFASSAGAASLSLALRPWLAAPLGLLAAANMVFLFPSRKIEARGPGQWQLVPKSTWSGEVSRSPLGAAYLDVGRPTGFGLFTILSLGFLCAAYRELSTSSFRALLLGSAALLLIPLFFTGRGVDFPEAPLTQARRWFTYLERRFRGGKIQKLELWGRYAPGVTDLEHAPVDEARVRVRLPKRALGLRALEVAFEEGGGRFVVPCVVVRALEGSPVADSLCDEGTWIRGAVSEERVLLVRPSIPTPAQLALLLERLLSKISAAESVSSGPNVSSKSSGSAAVTRNSGGALQAT